MPSNLHRAREHLLREWGTEKEKKAEGARDPACETGRSLTAGVRFQDNSHTSAPEKTLPVAFVSTIEDAVRQAALVIDCVPDELESKLEILWLLDRMAPPHAVFATPTRALSITDLASCTCRPDKCVAIALAPADLALANPDPAGLDPANLEPAGLEPANLGKSTGAPIELRTTPDTSLETVALLERFWRALGFEPVFRPQA
jgi:3-hydroxybutyryl-CoA dehydrogenase